MSKGCPKRFLIPIIDNIVNRLVSLVYIKYALAHRIFNISYLWNGWLWDWEYKVAAGLDALLANVTISLLKLPSDANFSIGIKSRAKYWHECRVWEISLYLSDIPRMFLVLRVLSS